MSYIISTTGTQSPVTFPSLGNLILTHPATIDLTLEYNAKNDEILGNSELIEAIESGWIECKTDAGAPIDIKTPVGSFLGSHEHYRELTMTGNITLTVDDEKNQYLDPDGATRTVTLPLFSDVPDRVYLVYNAGTLGADRIELYETGNGSVLVELKAQQAAWCHGTNVAWTIIKLG